MKLTESHIAILQAAADSLSLGVTPRGEWMCQGKEISRKDGEALMEAEYLKAYKSLRIITPAGKLALKEATGNDPFLELARKADLRDFAVVDETPSVVKTPHGRIGVSWQSSTNPEIEKRAEATAALIASLPDLLGQRKTLLKLIKTWEEEAQDEPEGSPSESVLLYCIDCVRTVLLSGTPQGTENKS